MNMVTSHAFTPPPSEFRRDVVIVSQEKFRLDSYFGCPARCSFRKNFPWLGQWVVKRESRDETRIRTSNLSFVNY